MKYAVIYKNGRPERFFIKIENQREFSFIHPYFLVTTSDHRRRGNILEMECLFSCEIWQGRQKHGYGYSACADVYGELIDIINKLYIKKGRMSEQSINELRRINTHDETIIFSDYILQELAELNNEELKKRLAKVEA